MFLQPAKYHPKKSFQCSNETPEPSTISNIICLQPARREEKLKDPYPEKKKVLLNLATTCALV